MQHDLRQWLKQVESIGELKHIEGAHWDLEIGCLAELNRGKNPPALLLDGIPGYPKGYGVLTSSLKTVARICHTLNLPACQSERELLGVLREKLPQWEAQSKEYQPKKVKTGPILENVDSGKDVNLLKFPVPKWHEMDGGRYIGTGHAVITRDPDTGQVNLGTYRTMVQDEKTAGMYVGPGKHGRFHFQKWHERGQPAPIAISVGHSPLVFSMSGQPVSQPEYSLISAIMGEPIKVIEEEITGLPIPADSEIVLAGFMPAGKTRSEGPFGEWTGYYGSKETASPIVEIKRVYHRNNPIILGSPPYKPPTDVTLYFAMFMSALAHNDLEKLGIPDVKCVWATHSSGGRPFVIVSIKQRYAGHAKQAGMIAAQLRSTGLMNRFVIVVDDDIDPLDMEDVVWAMSFRTDPQKDIDIVRDTWSLELDPLIRKPSNDLHNSRAVITACKPFAWMDDFPKVVKASPELTDRVKKKWGKQLGSGTKSKK